ncbi:MAG: hypothetical protein ACI4DS_01260 [Eubacterium sp.]
MKREYLNPEIEIIKYDLLESIAIVDAGNLSTEPGFGGEEGEDF